MQVSEEDGSFMATVVEYDPKAGRSIGPFLAAAMGPDREDAIHDAVNNVFFD